MNSTPPADPTGRQFHIVSRDGRVSAQIAQVGASFRALTVDSVESIMRYPQGTAAPAASGTTLVPWPNRVRDGEWTQRGVTRRLSITEPKYGNAIHGLLRYAPYELTGEAPDAVTLSATVFPQTGYPFQLDTHVRFAVTPDGVEVTHLIANVGADDAPVALGVHPFVCIGDAPIAELTVEVDGSSRFEVDDQMIPVRQSPVDAATDLRHPRLLGELSLDTAYADIRRDADDRISATLRAPNGRAVRLWAGSGFHHLQVFTTDRYPGHPLAVAIEPMTAPANALNSGEGLRWLAPGETWELRWGIISSDRM